MCIQKVDTYSKNKKERKCNTETLDFCRHAKHIERKETCKNFKSPSEPAHRTLPKLLQKATVFGHLVSAAPGRGGVS